MLDLPDVDAARSVVQIDVLAMLNGSLRRPHRCASWGPLDRH